MFYKPEIRDKMQRRRKELTLVSITQAAQAVAAQIVQLKEFLTAEHMGCYLAVEGELDTQPTMQSAHTLKKKLYLPVIQKSGFEPDFLEFHAYVLGDPLLKGIHGISTPGHRDHFPKTINELDVIFLPLVAFDSHGNRLGRGAGYYDRTLNAARQQYGRLPCLIGLGYEFQKIPEIIPDKWDVPLDIIVTEKDIYRQ